MEENSQEQKQEQEQKVNSGPQQPGEGVRNLDNQDHAPKSNKTGRILSIIGLIICAFLLYYQFTMTHTYTFSNVSFSSHENLEIDKNDKALAEYQKAQSYQNSDNTIRVLITDESLGDMDLNGLQDVEKPRIEAWLKEALNLNNIEVYQNNDKLIYIGGSTDKYSFPCDGYVIVDVPNKTAHVFMVACSDDQKSDVEEMTYIFKSVKVGDTSLYTEQK